MEKTAYALSGEDPENIPAIMEELMTYLEESWTDDLDTYGHISIPCRKEALFSFFESSCEDVDNYILHLADSHCSDVQELLESDEDEDEYEEKRSRREARNRMRSRLNRRQENYHATKRRRFESGDGLDFEEAQNHLEAFLTLPYVSVLFEGKRFLLLRLCNDGVHREEILVDTANAEYGNYLAYCNRFRNDSPAREGDDSPRDNEMLLDRDVKSYYDKHAETELTPSVFSYASNASEYRVLYFPDKGFARSVLFEGDNGLPYILKKIGWFGDAAKKIFGR